MTNKLNFKTIKQKGYARVGEITLNGVTLQTPVFMPVATKSSVKGIFENMLYDPTYIGEGLECKILLNNTYHMYLRPGPEWIEKMGGLHKFQNRDRLILTDSGGYQVFSLGLSKTGKPMARVYDDHIEFRSIYDGSKHIFTPQGTVDIQSKFGSDIMMMLDVCSPTHDINKSEVARYMSLTHKWAKIQSDYHASIYDQTRGVLFPIVQGGLYEDLRAESISHISQYARDGIAIGGLSVGESKEDMNRMLAYMAPLYPSDVPRYLMGVGTPEDLEYGIIHGIDMFDCVLPTRIGRHGVAMCHGGNIRISNSKYKHDLGPLVEGCKCFACQHHSRSYIHHLILEGEMMGGILLSLHNISYLFQTVEKMKAYILAD